MTTSRTRTTQESDTQSAPTNHACTRDQVSSSRMLPTTQRHSILVPRHPARINSLTCKRRRNFATPSPPKIEGVPLVRITHSTRAHNFSHKSAHTEIGPYAKPSDRADSQALRERRVWTGPHIPPNISRFQMRAVRRPNAGFAVSAGPQTSKEQREFHDKGCSAGPQTPEMTHATSLCFPICSVRMTRFSILRFVAPETLQGNSQRRQEPQSDRLGRTSWRAGQRHLMPHLARERTRLVKRRHLPNLTLTL